MKSLLLTFIQKSRRHSAPFSAVWIKKANTSFGRIWKIIGYHNNVRQISGPHIWTHCIRVTLQKKNTIARTPSQIDEKWFVAALSILIFDHDLCEDRNIQLPHKWLHYESVEREYVALEVNNANNPSNTANWISRSSAQPLEARWNVLVRQRFTQHQSVHRVHRRWNEPSDICSAPIERSNLWNMLYWLALSSHKYLDLGIDLLEFALWRPEKTDVR